MLEATRGTHANSVVILVSIVVPIAVATHKGCLRAPQPSVMAGIKHVNDAVMGRSLLVRVMHHDAHE